MQSLKRGLIMADQLEVNKTMLVILALHALGGESDLEHIAVKAHEMFPDQFCWKSFPKLPDKDAVRVHLSEAKKKALGELVADKDLRHQPRSSKGFTKRFALTRRGMEKAQQLHATLGSKNAAGAFTATHNSLEYKRIVAPILSSIAYEQFSNGREMGQVGRDPYLEAFGLFPDASNFVITGRISRAAAAVAKLSDRERKPLERFIQEGRNAFEF